MLELHHGALRLLVGADGSFALRRGPRELLRDGGVWSSAGTAHDRLVVLTEGVIAGEDAGPPSAPESVEIVACDERSAALAVGPRPAGPASATRPSERPLVATLWGEPPARPRRRAPRRRHRGALSSPRRLVVDAPARGGFSPSPGTLVVGPVILRQAGCSRRMESTLRRLPRRGPHVRKADVRVVRRLPGASVRRADERARCPQSVPQRLRRRY